MITIPNVGFWIKTFIASSELYKQIKTKTVVTILLGCQSFKFASNCCLLYKCLYEDFMLCRFVILQLLFYEGLCSNTHAWIISLIIALINNNSCIDIWWYLSFFSIPIWKGYTVIRKQYYSRFLTIQYIVTPGEANPT